MKTLFSLKGEVETFKLPSITEIMFKMMLEEAYYSGKNSKELEEYEENQKIKQYHDMKNMERLLEGGYNDM